MAQKIREKFENKDKESAEKRKKFDNLDLEEEEDDLFDKGWVRKVEYNVYFIIKKTHLTLVIGGRGVLCKLPLKFFFLSDFGHFIYSDF